VESVLKSNRLNKAQKATIINGILTENGISPDVYYNTEEDQNMFSPEGSISSKLASYIEQLSNKKETADVRDWVDKNHDKNTLLEDVTLTIDLETKVLRSPKLVLDFENAMNNEVGTPWYDNYIATGEISQEQINIVANKAIEAGLGKSAIVNNIQELEKLQDRNKELKKQQNSLEAELKYIKPNKNTKVLSAVQEERAQALRDKITPLVVEKLENMKKITSLNSGSIKPIVEKQGILSPQEKDIYTMEKARIRAAMDEIVNQTKPAGNLGCK